MHKRQNFEVVPPPGIFTPWVFEAQANKWSQRISALQMDTHLKIEGKNDIRKQSVGNQGP